ncbi:hypothetical protein JIN85_14090 [Luteolibacter pohnpeiensis]|uniref:Uncharacterized protein n=1 Tax=Luteolibacter pohnpeiensis TaxID=454153 RepID=A0A934VWR2_9BACT|nr:thrombospondin type 3 repeat-containing protein [Luteolibacter pohnpeiensis]MBK1883550.1 hypothetical protein [Luteolibacter pohnpeiensis]
MLIALLLGAASGQAQETSIGVSFSDVDNAETILLQSTESAGAPGFEQLNWNNCGRWGNPINLNDENGTSTMVMLKWDATALGQSLADPSLGGNSILMKGYLDSNGGIISTPFNGVFGSDDDKPTLLVTGLDQWMQQEGITSYSVVVYSEGDSLAGDRAATVWLANAVTDTFVNGDPALGSDLTSRVEIIDGSDWAQNPTFTRVSGTSGVGNYTVFSGLTAGNFYIRADEGGTAGTKRAPINGFQIIGTTASNAVDSDNDGLPDFWESNYGLDPADDGTTNIANGPDGDPDNDGLTNLQEYNGGLDSSNPQKADTDDDGLADGQEVELGTSPVKVDSDGDGLPDGWEVSAGLDPLDDGSTDLVNGPGGDLDEDGLTNAEELSLGTLPDNPDTDGDGLSDSVEDLFGEWYDSELTGTDPTNPDTDGDGILDGMENPDLVYEAGVTSATDPNLTDSDGDGINDGWEFKLGYDPTNASSTPPTVTVANPSFELPDAAGTYIIGVPTSWSIVTPPVTDEVFVESGFAGTDGVQSAGLQSIGNQIFQDAGVSFKPNTTYLVDLAGCNRSGFPTGVVEFGLYASDSPETQLADAGFMDLNGLAISSGNPDADDGIDRFRYASGLANLGSGSLAKPFVFVTGEVPPTGNIVAFIRHVSGFRVMFDNFRVLELPNSLDQDGDGLPDGQELVLGTEIGVKDTDGDGFTDGAEVAAGTDPTDPDDFPTGNVEDTPKVISFGFQDGAFAVSVEGLNPEKTYTLARSATLQEFTPVGEQVTGVSSYTFLDGSPGTGKEFYVIGEVNP